MKRSSLQACASLTLFAAGVAATGAAPAAIRAGASGSAASGPTTSATTTVPGDVIAPFAAHYTAYWKTIEVGTSDLALERGTAPGTYVYTWTVAARGIFRLVYSDDVVQTSWLTISGSHVRPERYAARQGASSVDLIFDWRDRRIRGDVETKPVDLALEEGTQDVMSIQVEVMLDLKNGNLPKSFHILDTDEIKTFDYVQEGPARIRTALGELDTVVVSSRRTGNDRVLRMWFAPSLAYVPVRAERTRGGKLEFAMRVKTLSPGAQAPGAQALSGQSPTAQALATQSPTARLPAAKAPATPQF